MTSCELNIRCCIIII